MSDNKHNTHAFNTELIRKKLKEIQALKEFEIDKHELRYTCTQRYYYPDNMDIDITLKFVVRDGEMIFYASFEQNIFNPKIKKP